MSRQIAVESFKKVLFDLLHETFEQVQSAYLDQGTSLFETLETISAQQASRRVSAQCACIAAQVEHVDFYLNVLLDYLKRKPVGAIDWNKSWQREKVTPGEWQALQQQLREDYQSALTVIKGLDNWEQGVISECLAILVHTAYHLGEIRQALGVLQ